MRRCVVPLLLVTATTPLAGQSLVSGVRDLNFGPVLAGVPTSVSPADPIRSGRFYVQGQVGQQVQVRLTLPNKLNQVAGGATLTIGFGNNDAVLQETAPGSPALSFNPHGPKNITLTNSPDFYLDLGGRVNPAAGQATGSYAGTLILTCTIF